MKGNRRLLVVSLVVFLGLALFFAERVTMSRVGPRSPEVRMRQGALEYLRQVAAVVELFRDEQGRLPTEEEFCSPLMDECFRRCHLSSSEDPYTGGRIRYWLDNESARGYQLASSGPDGVPGTADDLHLDDAWPQ